VPVTYSVLSATAKLGIGAEEADSDYTAPVFTVPFARGTRYRSDITQLTDRTLRGTDTDTQDIQQGPCSSLWTVCTQGYADWAGWLLRAMIGPDQCAPGVVTAFASEPAAGATSVSLEAAPPSGSLLMLGTGSALEYARCGTPAGTGPYAVPLTTPLQYAHSSGDPAQSQAAHLFTQDRTYATVWPSYSLTTDDGIDQLGWPGCILGSMRMRISPAGYLSFDASYSGFPPAATSTFTEDQSPAQPLAGWGWQITTAGGPSTRGTSLDLSLTRALQVTPACCGQQAPLGIFPGPMRASGKYGAIYDTPADLNLYREAIQEPAVWSFTQPDLSGGALLDLTMSLSGWTQGDVSLQGEYVAASYALAGIANAADSPEMGVSQALLMNFWQQGY
jgi:hypothetical protein